MVIHWNDYVIYLTPRMGVIATKWLQAGRYESWHCLDGHWSETPPEDLLDFYNRRIVDAGMVAVGD